MQLTRIEINVQSDGSFEVQFGNDPARKCADLETVQRMIRRAFEPKRDKSKSNGVKDKDLSQSRPQR